jgi:hypothetical protein
MGQRHQWLFGERAINLLTFVANAVKHDNADCLDYNSYNVLQACYSLHIGDGYISRVHGLECLDDIKNHTPMSYKEWILLHYPNYDLTQFNQFFRDYSVMNQTTYDEIIKR